VPALAERQLLPRPEPSLLHCNEVARQTDVKGQADIVGAFMSTCLGERMIAWTAFLSALTRPIGNQAIKAAP